MVHCFLLFCAVVALEEQRANLNRELSTLRHTHNKVRFKPLGIKNSHHCLTIHDPSVERIKPFIILL